MSDENPTEEGPRGNETQHKPQFDQEQYDLLKQCSAKKDLTEWNQWRERHRDLPVFLGGADLEGAYLKAADLYRSKLDLAHLEGANLEGAHLERAKLSNAHLEGANCWAAIVDGDTFIWDCWIDRGTNFTGVSLDVARVEPGLKQLLEYNVRRIGWEEWYDKHPKLKYLVRLFWWMSDYGRSTLRVIEVFLGSAACFAILYAILPGMLDGLAKGDTWLLVRALYFSVVTMTTLGFGDVAANPDSPTGHVLLMAQVILGYAMLGALITRFAILFTTGGPAANHRMQKMSKEQQDKLSAIEDKQDKQPAARD